MRRHLRNIAMIANRSLISIAAALALLAVASPKPESQAKVTDIDELKKNFVRTFGEDFDLLRDEVREKTGAKYWLAVVRPKRSGTFIFRHKFEQTRSYRYMDAECRIRVGERGCSRALRYDLRPQLFCVGDSVIIPIIIGDHIISHTFSRVSRFPRFYESQIESVLDDRGVDNPAGGHLKYIGREAVVAVHRDGKEASVQFVAVFEAVETGSFNLGLSPRIPGRMQHYPGKEAQHFVTSVVIVPREVPVIALIASESVEGSDKRTEPRSSSLGGTGYPTSVLVLRPGDRISLIYGLTRIPNNKKTQALVKEVEPVMERLSFSIDPKSYYNEWIIDHVSR
jgi:hypothetical protein